jgi:hypothetical protein
MTTKENQNIQPKTAFLEALEKEAAEANLTLQSVLDSWFAKWATAGWTDEGLTEYCARAIGLQKEDRLGIDAYCFVVGTQASRFDPMNNDTHVTALVKTYKPTISWSEREEVWRVSLGYNEGLITTWYPSYNRAICAAVAGYEYNRSLEYVAQQLKRKLDDEANLTKGHSEDKSS